MTHARAQRHKVPGLYFAIFGSPMVGGTCRAKREHLHPNAVAPGRNRAQSECGEQVCVCLL